MAGIATKKKVTVYLEPWQKRMLKDYLKKISPVRSIQKVTIDFSKPVHLNTYRVPLREPLEDIIEIYFTDIQKAQLEESTGLKAVDSMRLSRDMIMSKTVVLG